MQVTLTRLQSNMYVQIGTLKALTPRQYIYMYHIQCMLPLDTPKFTQ